MSAPDSLEQTPELDLPEPIEQRAPSAITAATILLCLAFFASGAAALAFETLWFHQAGIVFGNSVWASSLVLSAFMAGMALGSGIAARIAQRARAPLQLFMILELAIALSGVVLVYALPVIPGLASLSSQLETHGFALNVLRFAIAFALLLMPSTAMGMSLPVLVRAMRAWDANFGRVLGLLYGVNTFGAVVGTVAVEMFAIGTFGIRNSAILAAAANLLAAALTALAAQPAPQPQPIAAGAAPPWRGKIWLGAAFASGFIMLALEVVWLRCLVLFLNDTPLAFALILASVLAAIAAGSLLTAAWTSVSPSAPDWSALIALLAGLGGLASYRLYAQILQASYRADQDVYTIVSVTAPLVLPTALASGALFTLLGVGLQRELTQDGAEPDVHATGRIALLNMIGGGLGSLLAGFVILPVLGLEPALLTLMVAYGFVGVLLFARSKLGTRTRVVGIVVFVAGVLALYPRGEDRSLYVRASAGRWMQPGDQIVSVRESPTGTLVHVHHKKHGLLIFDQLSTNAYSMAVNDYAARRYMKLFAILPAAVHPKLERALIVGYGIGSTTAALTDNRELQRIDVADISQDTLELTREMAWPGGKIPLDDPRIRVHVEDGRHYLAGTAERYDLITGEPPPPIIAGVVNLYTREYFQLVHDRLREGGMASYWLPMMNISAPAGKAIIAAFCVAFDDCSLWHASARNVMLFGTRGAKGPVSSERFAAQWSDPALLPELQNLGIENPDQLGALFIGDAKYLRELSAGQAPLSDDHPKRIQIKASKEDRDALLWQWRDTSKARERFAVSELIARLWPEEKRSGSKRQFENQRLLNDLLFPEKTPARQLQVLHQVMQGTRLKLPVLLLLNSDPDIQLKLAAASEAERARSEWQLDRLAGKFAERDYKGALELMRTIPAEKLPYPEMQQYLEFVVERGRPAP